MTFNFSFSALAILAWFALLFFMETWRPLRRRKRRRLPRVGVNLAVTALGFVTGVLSVRPLALLAAAWASGHGFGLLNLLPVPFWVQLAAGVLLMDLTFYYWHRLNHTRRLLWRFHNVHHTDPDMDVTTSFRFHFGEVLYSTVFRVLQTALLGVLPATYLVYEVLFNCATMFHHSNLSIPVAWERRLNKVFVTPRMHGVHHSVVAQETNSNYSVIFSIWDRLNSSLRLNVPQQEVIIGVPGYLEPRQNRFFHLLALPFLKQRLYWRFPSGRVPVRAAAVPAVNRAFLVD